MLRHIYDKSLAMNQQQKLVSFDQQPVCVSSSYFSFVVDRHLKDLLDAQ